MDNSLGRKPHYTLHRKGVKAKDTNDLDVLYNKNGRGSIATYGFNTVHGFVNIAGGTTPKAILQPLELVKWEGGERLVPRGGTIGPLEDGDSFNFDTYGGGLYLLRVYDLSGTPDGLDIYLAGGQRANEGSI